MLVDPVADDPGDRPLVPPGLLPHLLQPGRGDVPVVAHVVVVPDHRGGDRASSQRISGSPQDSWYSHVYSSKSVTSSPGASRCRAAPIRSLVRGRTLIDIDLVARAASAPSASCSRSPLEISPRARAGRRTRSPAPCRPGEHVGLECGSATRQEPKLRSRGPAPRGCGSAAGEGRAGDRRATLTVEGDLVGIGPAGLEPLDTDQRVVMPGDREGGLPEAEDLDLARAVGLDPDRRLGSRSHSAAGGRAGVGPRHDPPRIGRP